MATKKNHRNRIPYTAGKNVFGEDAKTQLIVLKKETAFEQMVEAILNLDGSTQEYTFDGSCFKDNPKEYEELWDKVTDFISFITSLKKEPFYSCRALV